MYIGFFLFTVCVTVDSMVTVHYYLHNFVSKEGKSSIYCRVHVDGFYEFRSSTHERIARAAWNHEGQKVLARKERYAQEINNRLEHIRSQVQAEFREKYAAGVELTEQDLKVIIRPRLAQETEAKGPLLCRDFYEEWGREYLLKKNRGNLEGTRGKDYVRSYKQVLDKMHEFTPKLRPKGITTRWVGDFEHWLHQNYTIVDNTLIRYRKTYRLVLRQAGMPDAWVPVPTANKGDKFDLWWEEVLRLKDHSYSAPHIAEAAHTIVINTQLGLRWGDMEKVKPQHFYRVQSAKHGLVTVLNLSQNKTTEDVLIPVPPMAAELLGRYGWEFPLQRTMGGKAHRWKISGVMKVAAREAGLNRMVRTKRVINEVAEEGTAAVHERISTHIPRHTAATLMERAGGPALASALLGHAEAGVTHNYIHRDPLQLVDQLLEAWEKIEKGV